MATHDNSPSMPDWFETRLWTDDMLDAFRQLPVFPEHRPLNTAMWFDTRAKASRFATVKEMVFGRTSAVNAFCRFPSLLRWHWNDAQVPSWAWHMLMISSQWTWRSASSQHANFWLEPQICLEPSSVNTKPDGHLHKHAVRCACSLGRCWQQSYHI